MSSNPVALSQPGCVLHPNHLDAAEQTILVNQIKAVLGKAPLFQPKMPRSGKPLSVRMSNCGPLGWVADQAGYRYQTMHPETGRTWPAMPEQILTLWQTLVPHAPLPEACLINWYEPTAKMGLHQDRDEDHLDAPIVSVSLGDDAMFRLGGVERGGKTEGVRLRSGDVLVMSGAGRLAYHGITRVFPGTSTLLDAPGRINLTLRRVTKPATGQDAIGS